MSGGTAFITGATGALGPDLIAALRAQQRFERIAFLARKPIDWELPGHVEAISGDLEHLPLLDDVQVVIHAAANTRFRAPRDEQERSNVGGTQNILDWTRRLPQLRRFVFVSTTCVAGTRGGEIEETFTDDPPEFVNFYEATKWHAERLVRQSGLPFSIVRLSTAIGGEADGRVHRFGAIHYALRWMHRGLIPMLPGSADSPIDLISTDLAAEAVARCAASHRAVPAVMHIAAGSRAIPLNDLLDFIVEECMTTSEPWQQRQLRKPLIADRTTFELFSQSVLHTGDVLFRTVMDSTNAFLPGLLHPKLYQTTRAQSLFGGPLPLPNWRSLVRKVFGQCIREEYHA